MWRYLNAKKCHTSVLTRRLPSPTKFNQSQQYTTRDKYVALFLAVTMLVASRN